MEGYKMFKIFEAAVCAPCNASTGAPGAPPKGAGLTQPGGETAPLRPEKEAHAARLKKFKREQLIVDYLNRGVSIVEIAARIGVGEKRMRAIIREIIARRQPHPPEEFVAIQISRLNEAMLNAFSAMSPKNLKAVAQVVRIVGQLDRYHGFDAADWRRRLERARQTKPDNETATYGGALFCGAELALQDAEIERLDLLLEGGFGGADRPEYPLQELENIDSAPEDLAALAEMLRGAVARSPLGDAATRSAVGRPTSFGPPPPGLRFGGREDGAEGVVEAPASDARPGNPPQDPEKVDSALGISAALAFLRGVIARRPEGDVAIQANVGLPSAFGSPRPCGARDDGAEGVVEAQASGERPEIPLQNLEKVESAPDTAKGPLYPLQRVEGRPPDQVRGEGQRLAPDAGPAPHPAGSARHLLPVNGAKGPGGDTRPENRPQDLENIDSAPESAAIAERARRDAPAHTHAEPAPAPGSRRAERDLGPAPHDVSAAVFAWAQRLSSATARPGRKQMAP
jgi:hypothetical protein